MKTIPAIFAFLFTVSALLAETPSVYPDKVNLLLRYDAKGNPSTIASFSEWRARRDHIVSGMEQVMGPLPKTPTTNCIEVRVQQEEDQGNYIRQKITLRVEADDWLPCYLLFPKRRLCNTPAVLCLHQTNGKLGKAEVVGLGGKPDLHYGLHLVERGYIVLAPDYPNFGDYSIDVYKAGYQSATMKGIVNHRRCVDYLRARADVDENRIGVIGHSLGGHNAIFLGVFDERVKCIVSNCGFCSFPSYMKGDLTGWSHKGYMPRIKSQYDANPKKLPWDFTEAVASLAPRAFLASAPSGDDNFDMQGVKDCLQAAKPVYQLLRSEGKLAGIHPDAAHSFPEEARNTCYEWLDRWLKRGR